MEKILLPYKDKNFRFTCYATELEGDVFFFLITEDKHAQKVLKSDHFFLKISKLHPDLVVASGHSSEPNAVQLINDATQLLMQRFVKVTPNNSFN
jgi:hypothetical protein